MAKIFPILKNDNDFPFNIKRTFANLIPLTDNIIVDVQSNFYYDVRPDQLDPYIQKKLKLYFIFSVNDRVPMLFNNFTEKKGLTGTRTVIK
jgi:hypothetical protein